MFEQLFDGFRRASESSILAQQEMMKQWAQQWPSTSLSTAGSVLERNSAFQKRFVESATNNLNRQRTLLDGACRTGMQFVEQAARLGEAKSADDFRRVVEDLWRKTFEGLKQQSDAQWHELKNATDAWLAAMQVPMRVAS